MSLSSIWSVTSSTTDGWYTPPPRTARYRLSYYEGYPEQPNVKERVCDSLDGGLSALEDQCLARGYKVEDHPNFTAFYEGRLETLVFRDEALAAQNRRSTAENNRYIQTWVRLQREWV